MTWFKGKVGAARARVGVYLMASAAVFIATGNKSQAAPMATAMNAPITGGGSELTPFTVSNIDIGETLGTWSLISGSDPFGGNVSRLNNGIKYIDSTNGSGETTEAFSPSDGTVARLSFSSPVDITSIESLSAFVAARVQQDFSVAYSNDGTTFIPLTAVDGTLVNNVDAANVEVLVSIVDPTPAFLATNVQALQFTFNSTGQIAGGISVYREIDVFGQLAQAVPEASNVAIWSLLTIVGMSYCFWHRRWRYTQALA